MTAASGCVRLFVYGTLKRGGSNAARLRGARFVGETRTAIGYELVDLGAWPGLRVGGFGGVDGELWDVPRGELPALDAFEGAPSLFRRGRVRLADGSEAEAYFIGPAAGSGPVIRRGRW